ncbi:MAG: orotate phosphoribosyltransferase [Burkholderiaceae bacterium]|nr:orotate phosphoribosyltransferase [Burkholderiaceae bacterium]MEB2350683.1 orotate phosphoribosyltransferase [Burkholderiaceae bacterium]
MADDLRAQFIRFAVDNGILRFGEFRTKAGRLSPYFFNAGLFNDGASLGRLAQFYAATLLAAERAGQVRFDMLFGPAYKGITLASATAVALAHAGRNVAFAFNRKEAKDHGEGGALIGAALAGRVVVVDDVISAGTSVRESVELIRAHGAEPAAVLIALDRQERSGDAERIGERSAAQEAERLYGIPVLSIAALADLLDYLGSSEARGAGLAAHRDSVAAYRARYGLRAPG